MNASTSSLPSRTKLTRGLETALGSRNAPRLGIQIIERHQNIYASSFPSEFVTCRLEDGTELHLFCKYDSSDFRDCHGHRQNAAHEASVYRNLVTPLGVPAPQYYGSYSEGQGDGTWMFLEALGRAVQLTEIANQEDALRIAASEIGRFHRLCENSDSLKRVPTLRNYDRDYYVGWVRRTAEYSAGLIEQMPWLPELCRQCEEMFEDLVASQQTVIHGEFYPHNILYREGEVFLIDWQSAALGPGEIDLASLTEKWPDAIVEQCKQAYSEARWPDGEPPEFESILRQARLYLVFRWLGDRPEWIYSAGAPWSYEQLQRLASRMGLDRG